METRPCVEVAVEEGAGVGGPDPGASSDGPGLYSRARSIRHTTVVASVPIQVLLQLFIDPTITTPSTKTRRSRL